MGLFVKASFLKEAESPDKKKRYVAQKNVKPPIKVRDLENSVKKGSVDRAKKSPPLLASNPNPVINPSSNIFKRRS